MYSISQLYCDLLKFVKKSAANSEGDNTSDQNQQRIFLKKINFINYLFKAIQSTDKPKGRQQNKQDWKTRERTVPKATRLAGDRAAHLFEFMNLRFNSFFLLTYGTHKCLVKINRNNNFVSQQQRHGKRRIISSYLNGTDIIFIISLE